MAGRITFRKGPHDSVVGQLISSVEIPIAQLSIIEKKLGRELTASEIAALCDGLETTSALRGAIDNRSTSQNVKETLKAITKCVDPSEVSRAYADCDDATQCEITRGLYHLGVRRDFFAVAPELIQQAAGARLAALSAGRSGRPQEPWRKFFADFAHGAWVGLGRADFTIWRSDSGTTSPFLGFAVALVAAIEPLSVDAVQNILFLGNNAKK